MWERVITDKDKIDVFTYEPGFPASTVDKAVITHFFSSVIDFTRIELVVITSDVISLGFGCRS